MQTISWYQQCLKNSSSSVDRDRNNILSSCRSLLRHMADNRFREMQINRAIASKKDSFDDDKYMKNERIEHMKETEQRIAEALKNVEVALQVNQC